MTAKRSTIIVTATSIHPGAVALLADYNLIYADVRASEDDLERLCFQESPVAILVRYGRISERVIAAALPNLRVIAKHGVGIDNIDKAAATARGIPVRAALGSNSQSVAEHTVALMLACARRVPWLDGRMRDGHWDKDAYAGLELEGTTLGLIGLGAIGSRVARIGAALGQRVLVYDPFANLDGLQLEAANLDELLRQSDVISLHCPLTSGTRSLLDRNRLALLKRGAIVINTARAELIDEQALLEALNAGTLCAGIDCFIDEPLRPDSPWLAAPNVVLTPHIGGTTSAALRAMGVGAAQHIIDALALENADGS
jgi:D-3-phosphoglycerate dehydrogenase / 2-oxoglutarate reductase